MTRWVMGAALVAALAGCGGGHGAIFLTIEGRGPLDGLRVPQDMDGLTCLVSSEDGAKVLLDKRYELTGEQQFPLTLGLEPASGATARVRVTLTGLKQEAAIATSQALVAMNPGEVTSVTVVLSTAQ